MAETDGDWTAATGPEDADKSRSFLTLVPLVAIAVLVLLIAAVAWIVRNDVQDRTRTTLMSDSLWVEQALRFQLSSHEDMLQRAAFEAGKPDRNLATLAARARVHLAANPDMQRVGFFDADGAMVLSVPVMTEEVAEEWQGLIARATGAGAARLTIGTPRLDAAGKLVVDMAAPAADGAGMVVATVSLSDLMARHVPWWIAEKYAVQVIEADGVVLAEKARVEPWSLDLQQVVPLDPPLPGLSLRVAPYRSEFDLSAVLLPAGIVAAALLAMVSLVVLQRQSEERRRAEVDLAAAVAFRHSMEDSLTVGLRAKDHDGRVLYVNQAFCTLVGHAASDLVGRLPPMPFWLEDVHAETLRRQRETGQAKPLPQMFETRFRRPDKTEVDVQVYEAPLIDGQGRHRGWMGSFIDITEQKRAQDVARVHAQSLQRTGRLVTMGEMASTLAHELNQPLSAIASYATGSLNLLRAGKAPPEVLMPAMEKLALQADRAGQIIRRIQDFTRKRDPRFRPVDLARVMADSCDFMASDARSNGFRLVHRAESGLPMVQADPILLEQVLANLIRNGIEAMAANSDRVTPELILTLTGRGDSQIVEVIDNGTGIAPEIADRLFDPFTSTKADGMGIGLNICRSIIELHRGQLRFRPNPQGGTIFAVVLPARAAEGAQE
jgi:two-component system, LuxR family, sensor histidine kinase DctS